MTDADLVALGASMLCIGGPLDGQRFAHKGPSFKAPVRRPLPAIIDDAPMWFDSVEYRPQGFTTPQGEVWFWAPARQTPLETIRLLLEYYEKAHKSR